MMLCGQALSGNLLDAEKSPKQIAAVLWPAGENPVLQIVPGFGLLTSRAFAWIP